jgi:hypothetical protein
VPVLLWTQPLQVDNVYSLKRQTKEEKEAQLVGRLASPALKSLMDDHARWVGAWPLQPRCLCLGACVRVRLVATACCVLGHTC